MNLLLDTHFAYWLIGDPDRMRAEERRVIERSECAVSAVSIWEFRLKWLRRSRSGARKGPIDPNVLLASLMERDIRLVPLLPEQSAVLLAPPLDHSDPFDELLLAQAQHLGCRLLTRDGRLAGHPVALRA